jgi:nucleotide-binding universal stress UspA family protein
MIELAIRHILFPYDFSRQGQLAARYVTAFAKRFGAHITILSVVPPGYASEQSAEWKGALKCRLDAALPGEFAGVNVEREADCGDAALRIAAFAHNCDVDLVMMPTHGLGVFRTLLAGSVTAKVLHDIRCPIWTAAHADSQHAPELPQSILCAVDATTKACHSSSMPRCSANASAPGSQCFTWWNR